LTDFLSGALPNLKTSFGSQDGASNKGVNKKMKTLEFANRTSTLIQERPYARAAIVIGIGAILLLTMLIPTLASAKADDNVVHVTGTYISYAAIPDVSDSTVTHGSTTTAVRDFNLVSDITEIGSNGHGETISFVTSARDVGSNTRVATTTSTYQGTIGNSQPGVFSEILTYTVDYSNPSHIVVSGRATVIQGSGQGGLAGICGGGTFQGLLGSPGTFDDIYRFGASCASNSHGD